MSESRTFELLPSKAERAHAHAAIDDAPAGYLVRIGPATRSLQQNAALHALFTDIAKTHKHMGRKLTAQQWKTLFISGHAIATGLGADMVPGLENEYVNVRESSAQMSVIRMSSLMEYVQAFMAHQEVAA